MASTSTPLTLPVLPLDDEVVLPGMVVPLDLSDTEVRAAVEAAQAAARPRRSRSPGAAGAADRRDATPSIGVLGRVEQVGRLADGDPGALIRGRAPGAHRRRDDRARRRPVGRGHRRSTETRARTGRAARPGRRADEGVQGPRHRLAAQARRLAGRRPGAADRRRVGQLADNAGYSPVPDHRAEGRAAGDHRPRRAAEARRSSWLREHLAEQDVAETIAKDVQEGVDKQQREFLLRRQLEAVRKELAELNGDPEDEERGLPGPRRGRRPAREGARGRAQGGRQAGAVLRPVARGRLDPHLARHRPGAALERADRGRLRHPGRPGGAGRRPRRAWRT